MEDEFAKGLVRCERMTGKNCLFKEPCVSERVYFIESEMCDS